MFIRENPLSRSLDRSILSRFGVNDTRSRLNSSIDVNIYETAKGGSQLSSMLNFGYSYKFAEKKKYRVQRFLENAELKERHEVNRAMQ